MKHPLKQRALVVALLTISSVALSQGDLSVQANSFVASLDASQKERTLFSYDNEERFNWNFVPKSRRGLAFYEMADHQKELAMALLKSTLSDQGFKKAHGVLTLEAILREVEGLPANSGYRDPQKYYVSVFGNPSPQSLWGWRIEGHHVSLNVSSDGGRIVAATPSFFGANPATVPRGESRGKQLLKDETELGLAFVTSLNLQQLKVARFSERALPEIVSGNRRVAEKLQPAGIFYKDLDDKQKTNFLRLLDVYVQNYELGFSSRLMKRIKDAGIDNLSFAWAGGIEPEGGHYYRIQGPMLLIEYDNTQNNANHVHTVVRDLTNDFAADILREHYERDHK